MSLEETLATIRASGLPLQGKLDALRTEFDTNLAPPSVVEALHRSIEYFIKSGAAARALEAGDIAPSFVLPDTDGTSVSSSHLLLSGPLVVTFYRGIWCPHCNFDLQALEFARPEIEARGASLVAISQQTAPNSRRSQREIGLGFPIFSDRGGLVAAQFGVRWTTPDYLREIHRQLGADLTQYNGEESWTRPMPVRYVIGRDNVVAYAEVNPDYTRRPEPSDVFSVLDNLRASQAA